MHVPPVAQAERVLYTPRKEAEKHTTESDGSRKCAGIQALVCSWTLDLTKKCGRCDRRHLLIGSREV